MCKEITIFKFYRRALEYTHTFLLGLIGFLGFNGISTLLGYLMPDPSFEKNNNGTTYSLRDEKVLPFPKGISPKVNVINRPEFEPA